MWPLLICARRYRQINSKINSVVTVRRADINIFEVIVKFRFTAAVKLSSRQPQKKLPN
jgi:hypothetical protein